tara:strand:- start:315 stop:557 length:243 start_codon:yes stop_codon:yes gene_type:complete
MWPLRTALSSWRRANPEGDWKDSLKEIIIERNQKKAPLQIRKAVKNVIERLTLISSGHAQCPVPKNEEELVVWWSTDPPK